MQKSQLACPIKRKKKGESVCVLSTGIWDFFFPWKDKSCLFHLFFFCEVEDTISGLANVKEGGATDRNRCSILVIQPFGICSTYMAQATNGGICRRKKAIWAVQKKKKKKGVTTLVSVHFNAQAFWNPRREVNVPMSPPPPCQNNIFTPSLRVSTGTSNFLPKILPLSLSNPSPFPSKTTLLKKGNPF